MWGRSAGEGVRKLPTPWSPPGSGAASPLPSKGPADFMGSAGLFGCPPRWPVPARQQKSLGQMPHPTHRPIAIILFRKLPIVVVVESGVGLDGLLLTQVLVLISDTVEGGTGNLQGQRRVVSTSVSSPGLGPLRRLPVRPVTALTLIPSPVAGRVKYPRPRAPQRPF